MSARFQGSAKSTPFAPLRPVDTTDDEKRQLQQRVQWKREDNQSRIQDRDRVAQGMRERNAAQEQKNQNNLQALTQFSQTITKGLVGEINRRGDEAEAEGMSMAYEDGVDPVKMQEYEALEATQQAADGVAQGIANEAATKGATPEMVQPIRNLSGRRLIGYQKGKAAQAVSQYQEFISSRLSNDDKTEITIDGVTFTPKTAVGTPQKRAALAVIRKQFFMETGLSKMRPEFLNKYAWPEMYKSDAEVIGNYTTTYNKQIQSEARDNVLSTFAAEIKNDPGAFGRAIAGLAGEAGMTRVEARQTAMKVLGGMLTDGTLEPLQVAAIRDSVSFDGKNSWGKLFTHEWDNMQAQARGASLANFKQREAEEGMKMQQWSDAVMSELFNSPNPMDEKKIDELILASRRMWNGEVDPRLTQYRENSTLQARTDKEQEEELQSLVMQNRLTTPLLTSGKYSFDVIQRFRSAAAQGDALFDVSSKEPKARAHNSVKQELRIALGSTSAGQDLNGSLDLALLRAQSMIDQRASQMIAQGIDPEKAFTEAALAVNAEIRLGKNGQGLFALKPNAYGSQAGFSNFMTRDGTDRSGQQRIENIRRQISSTGFNGGVAKVQNSLFLTPQELKSMASPDSPINPIVSVIASSTGGRMSEFDVLDAQYAAFVKEFGKEEAAKQGVFPRQRPRKQQEAETLLTPALQRLLNFNPTPNQTARAFGLGGQLPTVVRNGPEGFSDVISLAVGSGHPNPAVAAAVWAIESGWGKARSGSNNVFGQTGRTGWTRPSDGKVFVNYPSVTDSVKDHVKLWGQIAGKGKTPMEGLRQLYANGYFVASESDSYFNTVRSIWKRMGIDPDKPYNPGPMVPGGSQWRNPQLMSAPARRLLSQHPKTGNYLENRGTHRHGGIDHGMDVGKKLSLNSPAVVVDVGAPDKSNGGYGGFVELELPDGTRKMVAHLSKVNVKVGDKVGAKQVFGLSGNTGRSTGPHTHTEVRRNGQKVDPTPFLKNIFADD